MTRHFVIVLAVTTACESAPSGGASSAKPSQSAATRPSASASASASAAPSAAPAPSASAAEGEGEAQTKKFEDGDAFMKTFALPEGSTVQPIPDHEGWSFTAPKGVKLPGRGPWASFDLGGKPMAMLIASPEQDEGDQCFGVADAKKKIGAGAVGGAKVISESTFEVPRLQMGQRSLTWGDTIELLVWEKVEGQRGFYGHKVFDHGDDSTHICCTAGAAADAKDLKGLVDAAALEPMVALCMSTTFGF